MRGKPAAAAPSFGERFRLPGAAAISSVFSCFSTAKSSRQSFRPVTRAAACGSYPHLFFCRAHLAKKKRPSIIHFLLLFAVEKQQKPLRPVTRAAACGPRAASGDHAGLQANPSRTRSCGCSFALVTQPEAFLHGLNMRPNAPKKLQTLPAPEPAAAASPL